MPAPAELQLQKSAEDTLTVALTGSWKLGEALPSADEIQQKLDGKPAIKKIVFDTRQLTDWDSGLLIFLVRFARILYAAKDPYRRQRPAAGGAKTSGTGRGGAGEKRCP